MADAVPLSKVAADLRDTLIDILRTFASADLQRQYQATVPFVSVPTELFCQWADDIYHPDEPAFRLAFTPPEREALAEFHRAFERAAAELPDKLPELAQFQAGSEAAKLTCAAAAALTELYPNTGA